MYDGPVQREELDRAALELELVKVALAHAAEVLVPREIDARLDVAQLVQVEIRHAEHEATAAFVRGDDGRLAESNAHPRARESRNHDSECGDEHDRPNERLQVH